jgi:hypothetical protein
LAFLGQFRAQGRVQWTASRHTSTPTANGNRRLYFSPAQKRFKVIGVDSVRWPIAIADVDRA